MAEARLVRQLEDVRYQLNAVIDRVLADVHKELVPHDDESAVLRNEAARGAKVIEELRETIIRERWGRR